MLQNSTDNQAFDTLLTASHDELQSVQLKRLQQTVQYAYDNVDFYQKTLQERGILPTDIKCLEDLSRLPFTDKEDLAEEEIVTSTSFKSK